MSDEWWRGGIIYQIYPRSFCDNNNDGIGDLKGITSKLDYIKSLGVDAIWISPFFTSPMKDFGYDVSDYMNVDPMFGTLDDFDAMMEKANILDIKIMVDMVISHTSDQHPWFKMSRSSHDNTKADWYVWADPKPDGSPPNNWLSIFGGSAWEWDTGRRQYYLHNFLSCQPDLNFHNPDVQKAVMEAIEFWLERGVKGFRMDTANFYFHDQSLRDNPPNVGAPPENVPESNPYALQEHLYDITQPENLVFFEQFRELLDKYDNIASVGEIGAKDSISLIGPYTEKGKRLNMVYTFSFLNETFSAAFIREKVEYLEERVGDGWPCWAFSNHDVMRAVSRWNKEDGDADQLAKCLLALLTSLRGSVCMYQGEELGLPEADIPFEKLQDPYGIRFWPEFKGRDGCRTPMPWQSDKPNGGFSDIEPWLPVPAEHIVRAVSAQESDPNSLLHFYRQFIAWRKQHPAFALGDIKFIDVPEPCLAFERTHSDEQIVALFNLSNSAQQIELGDYSDIQPMQGHGFDISQADKIIDLQPYGVFYGIFTR